MFVQKNRMLHWIVVYLVILFFWAIYRYFFHFPDWVDEFVVKPIIMLLPVIFVVMVADGKPVKSLGLSSKRFWVQVLVGIFSGVLMVGESYLMKKMRFGVISFQTNHLLAPFAASIATGLVEEVVYRGYFLNRILDTIKNIYIADFVQAILFVGIHLPLLAFSLHYSLYDAFAYSLQVLILGYAFGYIFIQTKSVFPGVIAHAMWNFSAALMH